MLRHLPTPMIPFFCCPSWMDSVLGQNRVACLNTCLCLGQCRCVRKYFYNRPLPGQLRSARFASSMRCFDPRAWAAPRFSVSQECMWGSVWFTTDDPMHNILATLLVEQWRLNQGIRFSVNSNITTWDCGYCPCTQRSCLFLGRSQSLWNV